MDLSWGCMAAEHKVVAASGVAVGCYLQDEGQERCCGSWAEVHSCSVD